MLFILNPEIQVAIQRNMRQLTAFSSTYTNVLVFCVSCAAPPQCKVILDAVCRNCQLSHYLLYHHGGVSKQAYESQVSV